MHTIFSLLMRLSAYAMLLTATHAAAAPATPVPIQVASYNLRYNNPGDGPNAWPARKEMVKALVRYHEFDIFGTQEGLADQIADREQHDPPEVVQFGGVDQ